MPSPIKMRTDYSAPQLRVLAKSAKTNSQSRRLLSLAAVLDGMNRTDAARIGGMDREPGGTGSTGSTSSAPTACATFVPGASRHGCPPIKRPNAPPLLMPGLISASMGSFAGDALICSASSKNGLAWIITSVMCERC